MRRLYLRGHTNILKRLLVHASGLNLGFLMRQLSGVGDAAEPPGPRPRARRGSDRRAERLLAPHSAFPSAYSLRGAGSGPDLFYDTASSPWTARATDKQFCHGLLVLLSLLRTFLLYCTSQIVSTPHLASPHPLSRL